MNMDELRAACDWGRSLTVGDEVYRAPNGKPWTVAQILSLGSSDGKFYGGGIGVTRNPQSYNGRSQYKSLRNEDFIACHKATLAMRAKA